MLEEFGYRGKFGLIAEVGQPKKVPAGKAVSSLLRLEEWVSNGQTMNVLEDLRPARRVGDLCLTSCDEQRCD